MVVLAIMVVSAPLAAAKSPQTVLVSLLLPTAATFCVASAEPVVLLKKLTACMLKQQVEAILPTNMYARPIPSAMVATVIAIVRIKASQTADAC
jgi:hypothetical protein